MKKNKEYKQIAVNWLSNYDDLNDKVVDKIAFNNNTIYDDQQQLIITFTDKTFIAIGIEYCDDGDKYILDDLYVSDPECINNGCLDTHINKNGKLVFDKNFQQIIDLGIYDISIEEVEQRIAERKKKEEEREYTQYLRLKEKFENK